MVLRRIFREVEVFDAKIGKHTEFDGVDMGRRMFIENKTANDLGKINPKTGKPYNKDTPASWAAKHIVGKTRERLILLANGTKARPSVGGSPEVPSLAELQGIRRYHFRVDATSLALRNAVNQGLVTLGNEFPGWIFTAEFGADLLLPPIPGVDGDDH